MPPLKSVKKLYHICNIYVSSMVITLIDALSSMCPFDKDIYIKKLNKYFVSNLHPFIIDNLLNQYNNNVLLTESQKLMLINVYINPNMKRFNPKFKLPYRDGFYEKIILNNCNKLVVLNLSMVCTDEILNVVGNNCPLLELIYIISKIESATNKTRKELNALKLKFFVSNEGLMNLHKCKYLKCIFMNKMIRSNCGGRKITHKGIIPLLQFLPNLQFISYTDMGLVLEEYNSNNNNIRQNLNLLHLHDNHIKPSHIDIYSKFTPCLKSLCLFIPTIAMDPNIPSDCLIRLSYSKLNLTSIILKLFPFDKGLKLFLERKGHFLSRLAIHNEITLNIENLFIIGQTCPNLKYLDLRILHTDTQDQINSLISYENSYFKSLECLILFGIKWNPFIIFSTCIYNATNLQSLILMNKYYSLNMDEEFLNILCKNPLKNLKHLSLLDGMIISIEPLIEFILKCENLEEITLKEDTGFEFYLEEIKNQHQLDLNIRTFCEINLNHCFCYV